MSLLKVSGLGKSFGGVRAVDGVHFELAPGELLALIGPNGAGKSTTFNMVNGQLRADRVTQTGAGGSVAFTACNHVRHTMTGNGTLTLSGGVVGGIYTVEVLQDGTGSRTVAWSGAVWPTTC